MHRPASQQVPNINIGESGLFPKGIPICLMLKGKKRIAVVNEP